MFSSSGRRTLLGLLCVAVVALSLRVWAVVLLTGSESGGPAAYEHGEIAANLLAGRGFSVRFLGAEGPTSQQAPFYPFLLAASYAVWGVKTPVAHLAVQLLQAAAGTLLVVMVARLAWLLAPTQRSIGWAAAWGAALFPTHIYMVTHLQVATWAALFLCWLLAAALDPRRAGTVPGALEPGFVGGLLLLTEPILALALPVAALLVWQRDRVAARGTAPVRSRWRALRGPACTAVVATLMIAPWLVRNWHVHGEFVFIKSTFGYAFWQGNNPQSLGTDKLPKTEAQVLARSHDGTTADANRALWEARHETIYIDDELLTAEDYARLGALNEPERCRTLGRTTYAYVAAHPAEYLQKCLRRAYYFLLFDETNPKTSHPLYRAATIALLTLTLIGAVLLRGTPATTWPLWAVSGLVTAFHALTITSVRFRIPLEPLWCVWAGAAAGPLAARLAQNASTAWAMLANRKQQITHVDQPSNQPTTSWLPGPHLRLWRKNPRHAEGAEKAPARVRRRPR